MKIRKILDILFGLLIISLLVSCSIKMSEKGNIYSAVPECKKIQMSEYKINVLDKRQYIDDRELKIPLASLEGMMDRISPKIDIDLENLFRSILEQFRIQGDKSLMFNVEILDIVKEFSADRYSETEYVSTKLKITVKNKLTGETITAADGEGWGSRKSTCAKTATIEKMLHDSVKIAFIDALNKLNL